MAPSTSFLLPSLVVGPMDIGRLTREVEALNEYLRQAALRSPGQDTPKLPRTTRMLDELAILNKLNLLLPTDRTRLASSLAELTAKAPTLHISFAVDPSAFVDKIIIWLRQNIHPQLLLRIGLQPTIAAGCVVRTPNHYYDLSLRKHFAAKHDLLIQKLESIGLA
jgi:hypothetical protein